MNEVEKHYATQPNDEASGSAGRGERASSGSAGAAGTARRVAGEARERVEGAYDQASSWASDAYESASRNMTQARQRSAAELDRSRKTAGRLVEENPIMIGVVGLAAGLLVGALLPGTRRENKYFGRYADEVRDQGLRYAQDLAEQGRTVVEENVGRLATAARGDRDHGDETTAR